MRFRGHRNTRSGGNHSAESVHKEQVGHHQKCADAPCESSAGGTAFYKMPGMQKPDRVGNRLPRLLSTSEPVVLLWTWHWETGSRMAGEATCVVMT